jgi:2-dehydro-3-deoxyphosphogluconate aldolase/(4S)-4-hydroxy-2-oxoglutarate aldolase
MSLAERLGQLGLIPVVKIDQASQGPRLAEALLEGGLPCAEITFRTPDAEDAIRIITRSYPGMLTGAGTVITVEQAERAIAAGARYIVSPGISIPVIEWCVERNIPVFPGIATPTDIITALSYGLEVLKFFPAEALGGCKTLQALSAPFDRIRFIPTGGVNLQNLESYIKLSCVHACGGSWFVSSSLISSEKFDEISRGAAEALALIRNHRDNGALK